MSCGRRLRELLSGKVLLGQVLDCMRSVCTGCEHYMVKGRDRGEEGEGEDEVRTAAGGSKEPAPVAERWISQRRILRF